MKSLKSFLLLICCWCLLPFQVLGQNKPGTSITIRKTSEKLVIDGKLDEPAWAMADTAKNFYLNFPNDTQSPTLKTEGRLTFNDEYLYVGIICYDDDKPWIAQSLKRDFLFMNNDMIAFSFDPYNDYTNGFTFSLSPYGVQREGSVSGGGMDKDSFNFSWDNKWTGEVSREPGRWVAEFAIPFKSFRYNTGDWNINFVRQDLKNNERSTWIATPIQLGPGNFGYSGKLHWEEPPPDPGMNISFIPYGMVQAYKDKEAGTATDYTPNGGFDAKVAITPSMNLDLTVNPDFSTVEVDEQVINLTQLEVQYPEKRQFFLENSDLFSAPGFTTYTQPFFSRRIGLASDSTGLLQRVPIQYGARLSGKIGPRWRIGLMNLQTGEQKSLGLPTQNYSVGVAQWNLIPKSNLTLFYIDKESLGLGEYDSTAFYHNTLLRESWSGNKRNVRLNSYNRVAGSEFNFISRNNRWRGKYYYHHSFEEGISSQADSYGFTTGYVVRNLLINGGMASLGKNYVAEAGFIPSLAIYPGYNVFFLMSEAPLYPKSKSIVSIAPGIDASKGYLPDGSLATEEIKFKTTTKFRNSALLETVAGKTRQVLPKDFNPLYPKGDTTFLKGQDYTWYNFKTTYTSNSRKVFTYKLIAGVGQYYNGHLLNLGGILSYRFQPYGSFALLVDYNDIRLPGVFGREKFLLVSPKLDVTFTRKLFFATFVQYNDRYNNVNLNARLQWRFKPASDMFLVYMENYLPDTMASKNKMLVLKFTYWLNL